MADPRLIAQPQPTITRHVVEVVDPDTEEAVEVFDVAAYPPERTAALIEGVRARLRGSRYSWREVREIDEDRWRADLFAVRSAGQRFADRIEGPWEDARGERVEPFGDDVPWEERQIADLLRWGFITEAQAESARR